MLIDMQMNDILERSLRANEGHIGVNESVSTIMKQISTQMNGYFLEMNSEKCKKDTQHTKIELTDII